MNKNFIYLFKDILIQIFIIMDSNIIYNENEDCLYILIYILGEGSYATIWFTLEIPKFISSIKSKKNHEINARALKVHLEDSYDEGILETKINDILVFNNKKSDLINYPLKHFIYNENIVILVYELALGSLYDILKKFNKRLDINFIEKIIPDMIESIKFVHNCGYIHTDIKPENYLLLGISKYQNDILYYTNKYNLLDKIKKNYNQKNYNQKNFINNTKDIIYKFITHLSTKFNITDNILLSSHNSHNSDHSNNSDDSEDSEDSEDSDEENSYISTSSDYNTSRSSYNSITKHEYKFKHDIFHIEEILKYTNQINDEYDNKINDEYDDIESKTNILETNNDDIIKYIIDPKIRLTDFGLIEKINSDHHTISTRYYRSPETILGLEYDNKTDIWSLGCSIYELITGKILFDIDKNNDIDKYDKDLITIKVILEKICLCNNLSKNIDYKNDLFKLIDKSNRKKYLVSNNYLLYYTKIDLNCNIFNELYNLKINDNIINYLFAMLSIDPFIRNYYL